MTVLTVHHLGISQSERIVWLCEELGLDYDLVRYDRDATTQLAPAVYQALHPIGTAPVVTDGKVVLGESGAIMDYILGRYGQGRLTVGPEAPNYADYLFWFHFANGSLMPAVINQLLGGRSGGGGALAEAAQHLNTRLDRAYALIERRLGETAYFAGDDFTAADIIMVFPLSTVRVFAPRDLTTYPAIRAYLERIGARAGYRRAMDRGDPDFIPLLR